MHELFVVRYLSLPAPSSVGSNEGWQWTWLRGLLILVLRQGLGIATGWMVSLPQCHSGNQNNVSSVPWIQCRPLYLATIKFKPVTATVKQGRSVMAGEVVHQGRMWKWGSTVARGHCEVVFSSHKFKICFKTMKLVIKKSSYETSLNCS